MAAPIDLSSLKNKAPETPSVDSLSPEEQEALQRMAEEHPEAAGDKVTTAFLVVLKDGQWQVTPDVSAPVILDREATLEDIWTASTKVARDIDLSETAQAVLGLQQQYAAMVAQQQQTQRIAQGLKL